MVRRPLSLFPHQPNRAFGGVVSNGGSIWDNPASPPVTKASGG